MFSFLFLYLILLDSPRVNSFWSLNQCKLCHPNSHLKSNKFESSNPDDQSDKINNAVFERKVTNNNINNIKSKGSSSSSLLEELNIVDNYSTSSHFYYTQADNSLSTDNATASSSSSANRYTNNNDNSHNSDSSNNDMSIATTILSLIQSRKSPQVKNNRQYPSSSSSPSLNNNDHYRRSCTSSSTNYNGNGYQISEPNIIFADNLDSTIQSNKARKKAIYSYNTYANTYTNTHINGHKSDHLKLHPEEFSLQLNYNYLSNYSLNTIEILPFIKTYTSLYISNTMHTKRFLLNWWIMTKKHKILGADLLAIDNECQELFESLSARNKVLLDLYITSLIEGKGNQNTTQADSTTTTPPPVAAVTAAADVALGTDDLSIPNSSLPATNTTTSTTPATAVSNNSSTTNTNNTSNTDDSNQQPLSTSQLVESILNPDINTTTSFSTSPKTGVSYYDLLTARVEARIHNSRPYNNNNNNNNNKVYVSSSTSSSGSSATRPPTATPTQGSSFNIYSKINTKKDTSAGSSSGGHNSDPSPSLLTTLLTAGITDEKVLLEIENIRCKKEQEVIDTIESYIIQCLDNICNTHIARVICIGDVHGCLYELKDLLVHVQYKPGDLVSI